MHQGFQKQYCSNSCTCYSVREEERGFFFKQKTKKHKAFAKHHAILLKLGILKLLLPLEDSRCGSDDMSGSETGCGDEEVLGLEAAADAGGLTSFSRKTDKGGEEKAEEETGETQGRTDIQMAEERRFKQLIYS